MGVAALIMAAGKGERMGLGYNKMFLPLSGKPLLAHTLAVWESMDEVSDLIVVTGEKETGRVEELVGRFGLGKVNRVVAGGKTRQESVYRGLNSLRHHPPDMVLIHDGARPFATRAMIAGLVEAVRRHGAAITAVPINDTVKIAEGGQVKSTLDRSVLWAAQTPQGFLFPLILEAHEEAFRSNRTATDDAALVEALGHPVAIVLGSPANIKITTEEDIPLAEALLKRGAMV